MHQRHQRVEVTGADRSDRLLKRRLEIIDIIGMNKHWRQEQ
jgi:hypothetical protein